MASRLSHRLLDQPFLYLVSQFLMGGMRARRFFVENYVRPVAGERILDIGCGPGYAVSYFPKVDYLGYDTDAGYIRYANARYGDRGRFHCGVLTEAEAEALGPFDAITLMGVLHHIDDSTALATLKMARRALAPRGRLVALEGCYAPGQSSLSKLILDMERGKFVRDEGGYCGLVAQVFDDVQICIIHDLFYVPYTVAILTASAVQPTVGGALPEGNYTAAG